MTVVVESQDCGNSPKNRLVQTLAVSIESGDSAAFLRCVAEDISWTYPGHPVVIGKEPAVGLLESARSPAPAQIEVENAISHGRSGAANGTVQLASGERLRFCHVVGFASAKGDRVARITSFYVDDAS